MTLNWAIIGTGFISNAAIDGIKRSDGSQLHSIYGRRPELVSEFQARHNIPHGSTDLDTALSDSAKFMTALRWEKLRVTLEPVSPRANP